MINLRFHAVVGVTATLALVSAGTAGAAVSGNGTLSPSHPTLTYTSAAYFVSNPATQAVVLAGGDQPKCQDPVVPCDDYLLDVNIPTGYTALHPNDRLLISISWPTRSDDFDLYVLDPQGNLVKSSATSGLPEVVVLPIADGDTKYTVRVSPYLVTGDAYTGTITLGAPPYLPFIAGTEPPPQFLNFPAPNNLGSNFGETSLGVDPSNNAALFTGRRYLNVAGKTLKVTFDDSTNPPTLGWTDVTPPASLGTSLDPIGYTDRTTGRTFVSQLHGGCSLTELSDDDGGTWIPSQGCGIGTAVDHQTLGGGPFAAPLTGGVGGVYPNAVYYCAQADVEASCAVSLDGGLTFGAGVPVYTSECSGLHGHIKVAPDGTVYLPNKGCNPNQGVVVSEDNGQTWHIRQVPNSQPGDTDPSVGIATDGTVYFGYVNGDGHPRVAVSHDRGVTWVNDIDVGTPFAIHNAVFPAVVAGDPSRASFAFHGTSVGGPYGGIGFSGLWNLYVATTYDGGKSWVVVNATPTKPVQGPGGICTLGFTCSSTPDNRNLLDFFDSTIDTRGRVLIGYSDGCTGACGANGTPNNFDSYGTLARQSSGLTLYSKFDPPPPTEDVTHYVRLEQSGLTWRRGVSTFKLKLKNVSTKAIAAPINVIVAELQSSSGNVTVANADNGKPGTGARFDYSALLNGDNLLSPKEVSAARDLDFNNAAREKFTVTLKVIRGNPDSNTTPAAQGDSSGGDVRYLRLDVDPLLGTVTLSTLGF